MSPSEFISLASLALALVSVGASWQLSRQALFLTRRDADRSTVVDLFKPLTAPSFIIKELQLWADLPSCKAEGVARIPDPLKEAYIEVSLTYQVLCAGVRRGHVNRNVLVSQWGYHLLRTWNTIEPQVIAERQIRRREALPGQPDGYLEPFEQLITFIKSENYSALDRTIDGSSGA